MKIFQNAVFKHSEKSSQILICKNVLIKYFGSKIVVMLSTSK